MTPRHEMAGTGTAGTSGLSAAWESSGGNTRPGRKRVWDDDAKAYVEVESIDFTSPERTHHLVCPEGYQSRGYVFDRVAHKQGDIPTYRELGLKSSPEHKRTCACGALMAKRSKRCEDCWRALRAANKATPREECFCGLALTVDEKRRGLLRCLECRIAGRKGKAA